MPSLDNSKSFTPFLRQPSFYLDEILMDNDIFIDDIVFDKYSDEDLDNFMDDIDNIVFPKSEEDAE